MTTNFEVGKWYKIYPTPENHKATTIALVQCQEGNKGLGINFNGEPTETFCLNDKESRAVEVEINNN